MKKKKPFKCNICNSTFAQKVTLKTQTVYEKDKPLNQPKSLILFHQNSKEPVHCRTLSKGLWYDVEKYLSDDAAGWNVFTSRITALLSSQLRPFK